MPSKSNNLAVSWSVQYNSPNNEDGVQVCKFIYLFGKVHKFAVLPAVKI